MGKMMSIEEKYNFMDFLIKTNFIDLLSKYNQKFHETRMSDPKIDSVKYFDLYMVLSVLVTK